MLSRIQKKVLRPTGTNAQETTIVCHNKGVFGKNWNGVSTTETPDMLVAESRTGPVYAMKTLGKLFDGERERIVFSNEQRGMREMEARLHSEMKKITAGWDELIDLGVKRNGR